jgi:DNA repair exonuclease SbcCD ATPase subunit
MKITSEDGDTLEVASLKTRIKQLENTNRELGDKVKLFAGLLESNHREAQTEWEKQDARIKQLEQQLEKKSEVTLMDVLWKENDQLQEDVEHLRATAATVDSLAKKAREVIDQFIDRTRELERLLAEKTEENEHLKKLADELGKALKLHDACEWPEAYMKLERLLEVKNEALRKIADEKNWCRYTPEWTGDGNPELIAQKALEQE